MWPRFLACVCAVSFLGCAAVRESKNVKTSGFLGDYSMLRPGTGNDLHLRYVRPGLDFSKYDRMILDPVQVWARPEGSLAKLPKEEARQLTSYLHHALREKLSPIFTLVDRPGPRTLRMRVALTEAEGSTVALEVTESVIPQAHLISEAAHVATGTRGFAGVATVEGELLDASTSERLAAAVDRREGAHQIGGRMFETWGDVDSACDFWAGWVAERFREWRQHGR